MTDRYIGCQSNIVEIEIRVGMVNDALLLVDRIQQVCKKGRRIPLLISMFEVNEGTLLLFFNRNIEKELKKVNKKYLMK